MNFAKRSPDLSTQKRTAGNQAFQKKKDQEAINLYSGAVFSSDVATKDGKKDCSLALANRSAAWIKQKKYESKPKKVHHVELRSKPIIFMEQHNSQDAMQSLDNNLFREIKN